MILSFIKGFLALFLLIKVLLYFVPKNVFEKYIAFFSGMILVIGLFYPLLQIWGKEEIILEKLQYEEWEEELLAITREAEELEMTGDAFVAEYYNEATEEFSYMEKIAIETISIESKKQEGDSNE